MATKMRRTAPHQYVQMASRAGLTPDKTNPRKPDPARLGLLRLSLAKLGFIMPLFVDRVSGLLLSGHQRLTVSGQLQIEQVPVVYIDIKNPDDIAGVNILFNRATNDFTAFDTGAIASGRMNIEAVIAAAEALPDATECFAINCRDEDLTEIAKSLQGKYDKKPTSLAASVLKMGIKIPIVISMSGRVVNGVHRVFAAMENGMTMWPVIRIPDEHAEVAMNFLNYLSMDFHVDDDFKKLIQFSAYRRPQNNRGVVPKAYRFWANGMKTLLDRESYSTEYWVRFRDLHGRSILDFGAGLGKVAPYLQTKGFDAVDFEPYRIDPDKVAGVPDPAYSKQQAKRFLDYISDPRNKFDSIFLASVLNSVPFPEDRLAVLAIVHALSSRTTTVYGTCRDISDFNYEYGGIRNANYFTFDTEPGVRVGDIMRNPKIQKFHTPEEASIMFSRFWKSIETWPGGNVFYYALKAPMGFRPEVVGKALELEFDLPYQDGSRMGLVDYAKKAFSKRLSITIK